MTVLTNPSYVYKITSTGILPFSKPNGKSIFIERQKLEDWMLSNPKTSWVLGEHKSSVYF